MQEKFRIKNPMAVPHLSKIVINMGVGEAIGDVKLLDRAAENLATITGQKPTIRRSKKAISNFKLRENLPIGCQGDITPCADVWIFRSFGECLPASYPWL